MPADADARSQAKRAPGKWGTAALPLLHGTALHRPKTKIDATKEQREEGKGRDSASAGGVEIARLIEVVVGVK